MRLLRICLSGLASLSFIFLSAQSENSSSPLPSVRESETPYFEVLVQGNNRLAFDFYHALRQQPGNLCFSSYSIAAGLAMAALGAKGETAQQFQHIFRYSLSLIPLMGDLNDFLQTPSSDSKNASQIGLANALWLQKDLPLLPSFKQSLQRDFKTTLQLVDFAQLSTSIHTINKWVSQQTKGKIHHILAVQDATANTRFILTTAMAMKGGWAHLFDYKQTKRLPFRQNSQRSILADMMKTTSNYFVWKGEQWEMLVLPYEQGSQGAQLAMAILLPKEDSLEELEKNLTWDNWRQWKSQLQMQGVELTLPRFRVEKRLDLETLLKSLEFSLPFASEADFSGMTTEKGVRLNKAVHKTFVRVDERGTEAIASPVTIEKAATIKEGEKPYAFTVDHPFIFLIWEQKTDSILWIGRVLSP